MNVQFLDIFSNGSVKIQNYIQVHFPWTTFSVDSLLFRLSSDWLSAVPDSVQLDSALPDIAESLKIVNIFANSICIRFVCE